MREAAAGGRPSGAGRALVSRYLNPRFIGIALGTLAVSVGLFAVHEFSAHVHLDEVRAALAATPVTTVVYALLLTALSFAAMSLYDVVAVQRVAPNRVSHRFAAFAGFVGYGFSNALGFQVFLGGSIRYRIYQTVGLDAGDVGRLMGISFLTFIGGLLTIVGVALLLDPVGVPAFHMISPSADRIIGAVLLAVIAGVILWLAAGARQLSLFGWTFLFPGPRSALAQIAIGAVDIGAAAGALYLLLPADVAPGYATFLLIFVVAILASVVSHAPGGLGVLEATVLLGLGVGAQPDILAALVVFRILYYLLPFALAALCLVTFEALHARSKLHSASERALALTRRIVPPAAAALVFTGGVVLLVSGATPTLAPRAAELDRFLPLPFAEASHLLASLTGLLLVIVARGLYRRMALARLAAIALLLAGAAFSLIKGLDWEEALVLAAVAGLLAAYGQAFYRKGDWRAFRPTPRGLALIAIMIASATVVGLFAYRHVEYQEALWWRFAWDGDASRFLRATLLLAIAAGALALDALVNRPTQPATADTAVPDAVREILRTSAGTQANLALLGDKAFLVSEDRTAFLMYGVQGRSWIAMGDPVGEPDAARSLIWRFAETADRAGGRAAFYSVQQQNLDTYLDLGLAILKTGEVALVDLDDFSLEGAAHQPLRYAHNRAAREGLEFAIVPREGVPAILGELRAVSDAWMGGKKGHEKGFSLGRFEDAYIREFDCAVMRKEGAVVAFANLWRSGDGNELSIDLMRYRPGVSKVMMDALFANLLLAGKAEGYRWFDLGAAPLSGLSKHPLASTWNRVGTFIYRHGDELYNFEGLRAFKQKFDPVWTPQYIACRGGLAMPQVLIDATTLIAGNPIGVLKK